MIKVKIHTDNKITKKVDFSIRFWHLIFKIILLHNLIDDVCKLFFPFEIILLFIFPFDMYYCSMKQEKKINWFEELEFQIESKYEP